MFPLPFPVQLCRLHKAFQTTKVFSDYLRAAAVKNMFDWGAVRESSKAIRRLHRGLRSGRGQRLGVQSLGAGPRWGDRSETSR